MDRIKPIDNINMEGVNRRDHHKLVHYLSNSFHAGDVGGEQVIQDKSGEFLEYILMDQEYFNQNWLGQFALGRIGDKCYFDFTGWGQLTHNFTVGVMVVNQEKEPLFVIRKFTDTNLGDWGDAWLAQYSREAANINNEIDEHAKDISVGKYADKVMALIADVNAAGHDPSDVSNLVPDEYYKQHGLNKNALQGTIYIRDNFTVGGNPIDPDGEIFQRVDKVLNKWFNTETVTDADKQFIKELTNGRFNFNAVPNSVDTAVSATPSAPQPVKTPEQLADDIFTD